jgi:DNA invertase Pin-like site-specific DNA recombinase
MREKGERPTTSKKVGGYVRVSTFEQAEKGTSIDEQKRIVREECLKRGWQLVQIYCDEGASGKLTDRQGLDDLQKDAYTGMFQTIMFTKSDRLTRSIRDLSNLWHDWTEAGIEIICVEQPEINSNGIYGKMMRNLLGIFAEWERDAIIERTASGRMARWRNNEAIMGSLPYGYEFDKDNRRIVFNFDKKIICKRIFRMYLNQGLNTREIAFRLSKASIPTPRGRNGRWHYATINKILKNPAYTGKAEFNMYKYKTLISKNDQQYTGRSTEKKDKDKWITMKFPPIISKDSHKKILERMKSKSSVFSRTNRFHEKYFLLENIRFFCGECGGKMKVSASCKKYRPDRFYTYYRCLRNSMSQRELTSLNRDLCRCDMRVDANILDNFIFGQVMEFLGGMVAYARRGLSDLSLQKITERTHTWRSAPSIGIASLQTGHQECDRLANWELTRCSESEFRYIKEFNKKSLSISRAVSKKSDSARYPFDQVNEFADTFLRIRSEIEIKSDPIILSAEISSYTEGMTIEQKKRVIESVIAPEYGGKCVIKWAMHSDDSKILEKMSSLNTGKFSKGAFRNNPQIIQVTFYADLSRIQTLIWGTPLIIRQAT